jgi:hypothetical protein
VSSAISRSELIAYGVDLTLQPVTMPIAAVINLNQGRNALRTLAKGHFMHFPQNGKNFVEVSFDDRPHRRQLVYQPRGRNDIDAGGHVPGHTE